MFQKAERKNVKLKLALTGPSGSGKTFSALRLASGMGGKIAVIDTENKSSELYSDRFEFDVCAIRPPFTTAKYIEAIQGAVNEGYDNLIIDSISHAWAGEGGILNRKTATDQRGGNSFTNWGKFTPEQEKFMSTLLQSDINLIATMRSKQDYIMESNSKGKQAPKKVGLAPVQREGSEYEFTIVFDVAMNHEAETSKDRTGLFDDQFFQITEETGKKILDWQLSGKEIKPSNLYHECLSMVKHVKDEETAIKIEMAVQGFKLNDTKLEWCKNRINEILKEQNECK